MDILSQDSRFPGLGLNWARYECKYSSYSYMNVIKWIGKKDDTEEEMTAAIIL